MRSSATRQTGVKVLLGAEEPPKNRICERTAAQDVRVALAEKPRGTLSYITNKSKDSAKDWKDGTSCPHFAQIVNLARSLPDFRAWVIEYCGGQTNDDAAWTFVNHHARYNNEIGSICRDIIALYERAFALFQGRAE